MNLRVQDIVKMVNVPEKTVLKWVNEGKIPAYKINGQYRFSESEINEWILKHKLEHDINISEDVMKLSEAKMPASVYDIARMGGIFFGIEGVSFADVISNAVSKITIPEDINKETLLSLLLERENMMPTAIGHGIAIPHPRNTLISSIENESINICRLKNEIDYKAKDGIPIHTMFIVLSANPKRHLEMLSKISYICQNKEFVKLLKECDDAETIFNFIKIEEDNWNKRRAK